MPTTSEWLYFASGALLPTLAYYWLIAPPSQNKDSRRQRSSAASSTARGAPAARGGGGEDAKTKKNKATSATNRTLGQQDPSSKERRKVKNETSSKGEQDVDDDSDQEDEEDGSWEDESSSSDDDDNDVPLACSEWGYSHAPYKMVLVVNQELNMGKGKIAAQCGHASVGCYKRAIQKCPKGLQAWERTGCAKIAVKCPTTVELETIAALAKSIGVPSFLVEDAGRTQIAAGSRTVLGLFGPVAVFGPLTDHLKLM